MLAKIVAGLKTGKEWEKVVADVVVAPGLKWSTRQNRLIALEATLKTRGLMSLCMVNLLKRLRKTIQLELLREPPTKAKMLSQTQLRLLTTVKEPELAVTLALMLPTGARHADVSKIRRSDVVELRENRLCLRIFQAKNVRKRQHQRFLTLAIPRPLLSHLLDRIIVCPPTDCLVTMTYRRFMARIKQMLGAEVSTYSIRRAVFEEMRLRVPDAESLAKVTLHRNVDQLRWYLERPTLEEVSLQLGASSWHEV